MFNECADSCSCACHRKPVVRVPVWVGWAVGLVLWALVGVAIVWWVKE